jgi:lipoprotein-anchoring transpeptidase ErfK/SrfK
MLGIKTQKREKALKNSFKIKPLLVGLVVLLVSSLFFAACGEVPPDNSKNPPAARATTVPSFTQPGTTQPATTTKAPATATPVPSQPGTTTPQYNPVIWFSSQNLKIGDTLTVGGSGYPANTKLNVALGFGGTAPSGNYASPTSDGKGKFSAKLKFDPAEINGLRAGRVVVVVQVPDQEIAAGAPVTLEENQPTPTAIPAKPPTATPGSDTTGKWIDVNLTKQRLTAYEGDKAVFTTLISSGVAKYPTVTGTFKTYLKYEKQRMIGGRGSDAYDLPNVPYVMYFYEDYAIHGAYWHNNFGQPMSHGCVNTPVDAGRFLYNWAPLGTTLTIHF